MRACVQRVRRAQVSVDGEIVGEIGPGMLVLLGVANEDLESDAASLADKLVHLRMFEDDTGRMNRSLLDMGGKMLVVSQFTLLGDCRKGRRPSFDAAAEPKLAVLLYEAFICEVRARQVDVQSGRFQAMMQVELVNDGPVTLLLDSRKRF